MGNCMSGGNSKEMKRTGTKTSQTGEGLHRTTSSFQGSVPEAVRYSDRTGADKRTLTASDLHKSKTLEEQLRKAKAINEASRA